MDSAPCVAIFSTIITSSWAATVHYNMPARKSYWDCVTAVCLRALAFTDSFYAELWRRHIIAVCYQKPNCRNIVSLYFVSSASPKIFVIELIDIDHRISLVNPGLLDSFFRFSLFFPVNLSVIGCFNYKIALQKSSLMHFCQHPKILTLRQLRWVLWFSGMRFLNESRLCCRKLCVNGWPTRKSKSGLTF